jgi:hypothetical protein
VKTSNLEDFAKNFSGRISKLPREMQLVFFDDLATAAKHRLTVLESAA